MLSPSRGEIHALEAKSSWSAIASLAVIAAISCSKPEPSPPATTSPVPVAATASPKPALKPLRFNDPAGKSAEERLADEQATVGQFEVFHDFRLSDRAQESGIHFSHPVVDDAARTYKAVHYDHGCGVSAADIDGDGRLDLFFLNQLGRNEMWRNLGQGRFEDVTNKSGLEFIDPIAVGAAFADYDNDGDPDLFLTTVRKGNHLYKNDGKGHFKEVTDSAGVAHSGHSSGAVFFDYDKDGKLDLFVTNVGKYSGDEGGRHGEYVGYRDAMQKYLDPAHSEQGILYHNLGDGKFANVTKEMGFGETGWNGDVVVADFNEDGWPDLYLASMMGDDHYYVNDAGKRFTDRTEEFFPKTSWGAMGIAAFDFDLDGHQDLFITDMHSDMFFAIGKDDERKKSLVDPSAPALLNGFNNIYGNSFWRNLGGGKMEEISDRIGAENYWPWGLSVGDLNADGWDDAFVTASMNYPFRYHPNSLLLNNRGKTFLESAFLLGVEPRRDGQTMTPWFELDCSGADKDHAECHGKTGPTTVMSSLGTRSSVILDVDDDGDLDIVTNEFGSRPQVLVSDLSDKQPVHWVGVRLRGTKSNRDGIGALVTVTAEGRSQTRVHDTTSGYLSHSMMPLYFGLGGAERPERIAVSWPSGAKQVVTALEGGKTITVVEKASP